MDIHELIYFNEELIRVDILELQIMEICITMQVYAVDRLGAYATFESPCTEDCQEVISLEFASNHISAKNGH